MFIWKTLQHFQFETFLSARKNNLSTPGKLIVPKWLLGFVRCSQRHELFCLFGFSSFKLCFFLVKHCLVPVKVGQQVRVNMCPFPVSHNARKVSLANPGSHPINIFCRRFLGHAGVWPIREVTIGHVTAMIGQIPGRNQIFGWICF